MWLKWLGKQFKSALLISNTLVAIVSAAAMAQQDTGFEPPYPWPDSYNSYNGSQFSSSGFLRLDTALMTDLLDFQNQQTEKQIWLIESGAAYDTTTLIVGSQLRSSLLFAGTNRENKFPYLGRFPPDFTGSSASDARLLHANVALAGHFTPAFHAYLETLFSDVFTFPAFNQGSFQMRQAYVAIGNFDVSPFYVFVGKKTVSFGDMSTLSPFSQSTVWHYFSPLAEGAGIGYSANGLNITATAVNGGRGIRVVRSPAKGKLNNFAVNASWEQRFPVGWYKIGAGYLHGTIYDLTVAEHLNFNAFGERNPAWNANVRAGIGAWEFGAEFTQTLHAWPVTNEQVTAYRTEMAVVLPYFSVPSRLSASWSEGIQGPSGSQFEFNRQLVVGLAMQLNQHALLTTEYVQSLGFAPLINITTVSDRSVHQHSAVIGLVLVL